MSSSRKRLLRLFLTGTVVLLLAGYGAFTTFFFNPFESDYEFDVATLQTNHFTAGDGDSGLNSDSIRALLVEGRSQRSSA